MPSWPKYREGPTKGTTCIPFSCASLTITAPGSATPGHPASLIRPIFLPSNKGFKVLVFFHFSTFVQKQRTNSDCFFSGCTSLIDLRAVFHFQRCSNQSIVLFTVCAKHPSGHNLPWL
jgi:hypothetical protein